MCAKKDLKRHVSLGSVKWRRNGRRDNLDLTKGHELKSQDSALRLQEIALFTHSLSQRLISEAMPREEQSTKQSGLKFQQTSWRDTKTKRDIKSSWS